MKSADKLNELNNNVIINSDSDNFQRITDELYQKASNDKEKNMITEFIEKSLVNDFENMKEVYNSLSFAMQEKLREQALLHLRHYVQPVFSIQAIYRLSRFVLHESGCRWRAFGRLG